jgi:hypothetical protein
MNIVEDVTLKDIFWLAEEMYGGMETQFHLIQLRVNSPWYRFDGVIGVSASLNLVEKKSY